MLSIEEKIKRIDELLEEKKVYVFDDYIYDDFKCEETDRLLFSVKSSRHFKSDEESQECLDIIIDKLEKHENAIQTK